MAEFFNDVKVFKSLSDENRLAILKLLKQGEKCGCKILAELKISQPTLSHHMKVLCEAGIVNCRKDGKLMNYSINNDNSSQLFESLNKYI